MIRHLVDGIDPLVSPLGLFQVSLSLVPNTEVPYGSSEASLSCGSKCWRSGTDQGPVASSSWSARPGKGQAQRELRIALRRGPEETEGGVSPGSASLRCLSLSTQLLEAGVSPLSFSARPTVSVLAVLRKYVLNK